MIRPRKYHGIVFSVHVVTISCASPSVRPETRTALFPGEHAPLTVNCADQPLRNPTPEIDLYVQAGADQSATRKVRLDVFPQGRDKIRITFPWIFPLDELCGRPGEVSRSISGVGSQRLVRTVEP